VDLKLGTDIELLDWFNSGNDDAFTEIYNRYWKRLLGVAYNLTKDKASAQEIVQEVFTSLWLKQGQLQINSLSAYLAGAVRFSVFKHYYQEKRRQEVEAKSCTEELSTLSEEEIEARFTEAFVNQLIDRLPDKCRLVFKYSRHEGMTVPEISMKLGIAEKTVEGHLTKGLKALRLSLQNALNMF
jgi:RNA polymerase sigma-70 factor (family 1)